MIRELRFRNFYSFSEETVVSFEVGKQPGKTSYDVELGGSRINKVIAVVGANGSGKTQLLRVFAFLHWFVSTSYQKLEPDAVIPFKTHAFNDKPSFFELRFIIGEVDYKYELELTEKYVIREALYEKTSRAYSYIFVRQLIQDGEYEYKQKGFGLRANEAKNVKGNASLLSAANMFGHDLARKVVKAIQEYQCNVTNIGRQNYHEGALLDTAESYTEDQSLFDNVKRIIKELDLGLDDIEIREHTTTTTDGEETTVRIPYGVHRKGDSNFTLPMFEESSGTKSLFVLLNLILPAIESGSIAIADEIDNDLHPHMLPFVLDLFKNSSSNAQLIFSCHTADTLNLLKKHQIYLVEKTDLESEAWRLDEVTGLRADDNLSAKYLAGALGAIPAI